MTNEQNKRNKEILMLGLEAGFSVTTFCGQSSKKLMPQTDLPTLVKFAELLQAANEQPQQDVLAEIDVEKVAKIIQDTDAGKECKNFAAHLYMPLAKAAIFEIKRQLGGS